MKITEMEARGSKTLVDSEPMKHPGWLVWSLMKGFRLVLLTVLWTGLGMGVGLFCGILGTLILGAVRHVTPDMSLAYRHVSIPVAVCSGSGAFLWNLVRTWQSGVQKRRAQSGL